MSGQIFEARTSQDKAGTIPMIYKAFLISLVSQLIRLKWGVIVLLNVTNLFIPP
jgi:ABC-type phosphate transport system permease subunit